MEKMKIILVPVNQNITIIGDVSEDGSNVLVGRTACFDQVGQCVVSKVNDGESRLYYVCVSGESALRAIVAMNFGFKSEFLQLQKDLERLQNQKPTKSVEEKIQKIQDRLRMYKN